jgi:hypothetical protein
MSKQLFSTSDLEYDREAPPSLISRDPTQHLWSARPTPTPASLNHASHSSARLLVAPSSVLVRALAVDGSGPLSRCGRHLWPAVTAIAERCDLSRHRPARRDDDRA